MSMGRLKTWIWSASLAIVVWQPATVLAQVPNLHQGPVFLIIGENLDYQAITARSAPFITQVLRPQSAWVVNFFGLSHGSLSDYIGLTSGQFNSCHEEGYGSKQQSGGRIMFAALGPRVNPGVYGDEPTGNSES